MGYKLTLWWVLLVLDVVFGFIGHFHATFVLIRWTMENKYIHTIKKLTVNATMCSIKKTLWRDSRLNRRPGHFHQVIQGNSKASQHTREIKSLQRCPRSASGSPPRCTWMEHLSREALGSRADQKSGSPQHGGPTALLWASLLEM